ncbi:hypothetical protein Syun_018776 [Stephania yunnanensis]|uniref:Peroxidase n=1 Tax=Stephania yunnanensis TaxID=152371 RepID=A0AAP0IT14_9MAGN
MKLLATLALALGLILLNISTCLGDLRVGFYKGKCRNGVDVEVIVRGVVTARFNRDHSIVAALLRLYFHDCFVNGCDGSILIDGPNSEKKASPNGSVRGYDIINEAKAAVERECPGVVSCADIIALATRDAVALSVGWRWKYDVETGRRDGLVPGNVDLPPSRITVSQSIQVFANKGLTVTDMVMLLGGGHSVGFTHCPFIMDRLYNFNNTNKPDPNMSPFLLTTLRSRCPPTGARDNQEVDLDQNPFSAFVVDPSSYQQAMMRRAILWVDQELAMHPETRGLVASMARGSGFPAQFGGAMTNLGRVGVLTGNQGQVRNRCNLVNPITAGNSTPAVANKASTSGTTAAATNNTSTNAPSATTNSASTSAPSNGAANNENTSPVLGDINPMA